MLLVSTWLFIVHTLNEQKVNKLFSVPKVYTFTGIDFSA